MKHYGPDDRSDSSTERGQTTIDFAIGASIFLISIAFIFSFTPGLLQPFYAEGNPGAEVAAERASSTIVGQFLTANQYSDGPTTLDTTCTTAFFEGNDVSGCRYEGGDVADEVGMSARNENVNVTVRRLDGSIETYDGTRLASGPSPRVDQETAVTTRVVYMDGETYRFVVKVW